MKTYVINLENISEAELEEWFSAMSEDKKRDVINLKNHSKWNSKITSDHICRKAVSEFCGIPENEITFSKNEFGKPYTIGLDVHFNVSHSGSMVVCVVSDKEIGTDIEKKRDIRIDAAKRFANKDELEYIGDNTDRFFEIWTLKEAYFKCIGTGLNANIKNVSFTKTDSGFHCSEAGFNLTKLDLPEGYTGFICEKE